MSKPATDVDFNEKLLPVKKAVDLFCRVIDNYGDIGVSWRLARQLVAEHGYAARLIVDDLNAFRFIAPEIDVAAAAAQMLQGVEIVPWHRADALAPAAVVIEAFACDPPPAYVTAMAARMAKPVWLNLEYLSAESWVDDIHARPSPHPRLPLTKYFFCPGFTEQSGGLIREHDLTPLPPRSSRGRDDPLQIFAFTYPQAPVRAVADALSQAGYDVAVGTAAPLRDRDTRWSTVQPVPQPDFDALLARFDLLLVRGEDSFVRAQWAGKPMLWHIYPTDDDAHRAKLDAWLDRYCDGLPAKAASAYWSASHAFISAEPAPAHYAEFAQHFPALQAHAQRWRERLAQQTDLATRVVDFVRDVRHREQVERTLRPS